MENHFEILKQLGFIGDYKTFEKLERRTHRLMEHYCNVSVDEKRQEQSVGRILQEVKLFFKDGILPEGFFINFDPRGYTFKIKDNIVREKNIKITRDWGGYGILCPEDS